MRILFLHRLDLIHLYAPVSKKLAEKHEIIHVAFTNKEQEILVDRYKISTNIFNLSKLRNDFYDNLENEQVNEKDLDDFIFRNTDGRFNLNSSIHFDRTYGDLNLKDSVNISLAYFKAWQFIFNNSNPNILFHEPPAIFATHLASIFCKYYNAHYLTQIHVIGQHKLQWIFLEGDNAYPIEIELNKSIIDLGFDNKQIDEFINTLVSNQDILMSSFTLQSRSINNFKILIFIKKVLGLFVKKMFLKFKRNNKVNPKNHIFYSQSNNQVSFFTDFENIYGRLFHNYYSEPKKNEKYFFYPLHLEPEAVVLYYADGWYEGQLKLIENIAVQLPFGTFLYVKDHPHGGEYRNVRDYKRLLRIKNIKLIHHNHSGKSLIKNSIGVITINGTAGFEALLMRKYVFCFGKSFYSNFKGIMYLDNIKQLRKAILSKDLQVENSFDYNDVRSYLSACHEGFVSYFSGRQDRINIDFSKNTSIVADAIEGLISKIQNTK